MENILLKIKNICEDEGLSLYHLYDFLQSNSGINKVYETLDISSPTEKENNKWLREQMEKIIENNKDNNDNLEVISEIAELYDWNAELHTTYSNNGENGVYVYEFSKYSPAGEDFNFSIWSKPDIISISKEIEQYSDNFDSDEHIEMWVEARDNVSGVPDVSTLAQDARDIDKMLQEFSGALSYYCDKICA